MESKQCFHIELCHHHPYQYGRHLLHVSVNLLIGDDTAAMCSLNFRYPARQGLPIYCHKKCFRSYSNMPATMFPDTDPHQNTMLALPTGAGEQQCRDDREPGAAPPNCGRSHPGRLPAPTKKTGLTPANHALYSSFDHRWLWKLLPGESGTRREPEHNLAAPASIQTKGLQPKGLCILFSTSRALLLRPACSRALNPDLMGLQ